MTIAVDLGRKATKQTKSICLSGNDIRFSKFGMSSCHGECLIELGRANLAISVLLQSNRL